MSIEPRRASVDGNGWQELPWRGEHESKVEVGVWRDATRQAGYAHHTERRFWRGIPIEYPSEWVFPGLRYYPFSWVLPTKMGNTQPAGITHVTMVLPKQTVFSSVRVFPILMGNTIQKVSIGA
ncbi:BQ5605_C036g11502 [Microbotryum silenes-dioicae]|uniref:BQ5605_C036g11502 protein n=1 Tax=Microbotryum silenes-dioicae TaxID=796604 RepID=A0A2X0MJH0_9BASI|nr:BQ5605_C036g11502 [Microbotryum silenes-dioicae]